MTMFDDSPGTTYSIHMKDVKKISIGDFIVIPQNRSCVQLSLKKSCLCIQIDEQNPWIIAMSQQTNESHSHEHDLFFRLLSVSFSGFPLIFGICFYCNLIQYWNDRS